MSEITDAASFCAMRSNMSRSVANSGMDPPSLHSLKLPARR
jgi:hypothetical protein